MVHMMIIYYLAVGTRCWLGSGWLKERSDSGGAAVRWAGFGSIAIAEESERIMIYHDHGMGFDVFGGPRIP